VEVWGKAPRSQICIYNLQWTNAFYKQYRTNNTLYSL